MSGTLEVDGASPDRQDDVDSVTEEEAASTETEETGSTETEETGSTETDETATTEQSAADEEEVLVREGDVAGDYLERLLDILDYDGDIDLDVEAGRAMVSIEGGSDLEKLVGQRGQVLEALQELTRLAVQTETSSRSRLMLDIARWRASRRGELTDLGRTTAEKVAESGESAKLHPMTPFERKIVHDAVADVPGVTSESEGEEPNRRVVVVSES